MKRIVYMIGVLSVLMLMTACSEEGSDKRPGLWTELDLIETYPGSVVLLKGQASNYIGLKSVRISCAAWDIDQVYELSGEQSKVFDFNYQLKVPADAEFDQLLLITVTDTEGTEQKKVITMTYAPDTEAPAVAEELPAEIGIEIENLGDVVNYPLVLNVSDSRGLKSATVAIPALGINDEMPLSGTEATIEKNIEVSEGGEYDMTVTITNVSGNSRVMKTVLKVIPPEVEYPVSQYTQMYMVLADESADDYVFGYYRFLECTKVEGEQQEQQYSNRWKEPVYIPKDNQPVYFVPTQSMDGDLFGASPRLSSKVLNNRDYVVPIIVEKAGYYDVWIDTKNHKYTFTPYEVSADAYQGDLAVMATAGFAVGDWKFSGNMQRNGYVYSVTMDVADGASSCGFCLSGGQDHWDDGYRYGAGSGWESWWKNSWNGASDVATFNPKGATQVEVTFDTAALWATVKKVNNQE